jgi:hypothetical protein
LPRLREDDYNASSSWVLFFRRASIGDHFQPNMLAEVLQRPVERRRSEVLRFGTEAHASRETEKMAECGMRAGLDVRLWWAAPGFGAGFVCSIGQRQCDGEPFELYEGNFKKDHFFAVGASGVAHRGQIDKISYHGSQQ